MAFGFDLDRHDHDIILHLDTEGDTMANMNDSKTKVVHKNLPWGVYVWRCASGRVLSDEDGNVLNMPGFKGDLNAIKQMRTAATYYGEGDGKPAFLPGSRRVSDSEYEDQMEALIEGNDIPGDIDA